MPPRSTRNVSLTPELASLVEAHVASGRYRSASEVIREALRQFQQDTPAEASPANQAFLLRFADRISPLKDPRRIMAEAAFLLGSFLAADRAGYADITQDGEHCTILEDWVSGDVPSLAGRYRLADFGARLIATLRQGQTVSFADAETEPLVQEAAGAAAALAAVGNRASISVPLVKDGRMQAVLYVHQREPRDWSEAEETLAREIAERTWSAVERARAEAARDLSEARFRAIFDTTQQFIGLLSPVGIVLEANRAALEFGGLQPGAIVGRPLWETDWFAKSPDSDAAVRLQSAITEAASGDEVRYEVDVHAAGGRVATVDFNLRPIRDGSNRTLFLVPEGHDITDAKQAMRRLAESESRFRTLTDAMPQMIWAGDRHGKNVYCNARFLDFVGLSHGGPGVNWAELVHPDDRAASEELRRQTLISGKPFEREHRLRRFDGVYRWVLARAVPVHDAAGQIEAWFGTSTDITDIVEARLVLAQSHTELERLVEERTRALQDAAQELAAEMRRREEIQNSILQAQKLEAHGQLTSGVAHDFNNMLAAIRGSYNLIRRRVETPDVLRIVDHGEQAVEKASKLIGQLLTFVRREKLTPKLLILAKVLDGAQDLVQHAVGSRIACRFEVSAGVHPVLADAYQLEVALLNLAVNARDAMGPGGEVIISARNVAESERPAQLAAGDYVAVAVHDTGRGMPPEILARATEAFFTTKPDGQGTGLGLAMVHGFASRSGGCLRIDSQPGVGTTVEIILPRAPIETLAQAEHDGAAPDPALHGDATLLLVDDDEQFRQVTASFLRELGYTVLEANNAETANALVHTLRQLDLLLTDEVMPGASGQTLVMRLRADWPGLPVLFLTGGTAPGLVGEAVLCKPFSFAALGATILERLGRWTAPGAGSDRLLKRFRAPALRQLYLNWHTAKTDGALMPKLSGIDPLRFGLGPHAYTVAVEDGEPPTFRFVSVGTALTRRLGRPLNGSLVDDMPGDEEVLGEFQASYRRCARNLTPVYQSARFSFGDGSPLHVERLLLPLSEDARAITHLVGIVMFREHEAGPDH